MYPIRDCSILVEIQNGYAMDLTFAKVLKNIGHHRNFVIADSLIYTHNHAGDSVLCIPSVVSRKQCLMEIVITQAHKTLGHFGLQKMADYIHCHYWWSRIKHDVEQYCKTCLICQTTRSSTQQVPGLLHSLPIPMHPWGSIVMDFVGPFLESNRHDYLWVVICCLMSMVHLILIHMTTKASELTWLYIWEIVQLHGLAESIVSDRDSKFTSKFWRKTHKILGTKLLMSTLFHLQTDGASEQVICLVSQILHAMVQPDQQDWSEKLPMVEFALNSAISSSSSFAPFKLNYGHMPIISPGINPSPSDIPGMKHFIVHALRNLADTHDTIIESRVHQTHHANCWHCGNNHFAVGDLVYMSMANLSLPKGHAFKLLLQYIGPFKVLKANPSTLTYGVKLPMILCVCNIYDKFHRSKLRPYHMNDDALFPHQEAHALYDFGTPDDHEQLVDKIIAHKWEQNELMFQLHWNNSNTTWESHDTCKDLQALNDYLHLLGIEDPFHLPQQSIIMLNSCRNSGTGRLLFND
jgi:hypothetical protein